MLVEESHGGADADIVEISRAEPEQLATVLAARNWPPTRPGCPGWRAPIRNNVTAHAPETPAGEGEVFGGRDSRERYPDGPFATLIRPALSDGRLHVPSLAWRRGVAIGFTERHYAAPASTDSRSRRFSTQFSTQKCNVA
jgi:hypothetical protein